MSCSTHAGFRRPGCTAPTCSLKGRELRASVSSLAAPLFQSRAVGVAPDAIAAALEAFEVGRHRAELVGVIDGVPMMTVQHPDGLRTTYQPVEASVAAGQAS